jgi:hypothetical protein
VVPVVNPRTVLVLGLDLHGFRALGDEVPVLITLVAHARAPPSILPVCVHVLEPPAQQREVLLAQHVNSSSDMDTRQDKENVSNTC